MHWLVTIKGELDPRTLRTVLARAGVEKLYNLDSIPLDGDQVVEVEGPSDLPDCAAAVPEIRAVHPSSEVTLY